MSCVITCVISMHTGAGDMSEHEGDGKTVGLRDMSVDRSKRDEHEGEPDR